MHSLRIKLLAPFIAGTLIFTVLLAWYTYSSARVALKDATMLITEAKTNNAVNSMALLFKSMATNMQNFVVDPHVTDLFNPEVERADAQARIANWLEIITHGNEYYRDIIVIDINGICIASSNPSYIGYSFMDRDYVRNALLGMFNFGAPTVGRVTKNLTSFSAGPVDSPSGVVGAVVVVSDLPRIVDYDTEFLHPGEEQPLVTTIIEPGGMFIAHTDRDVMGNTNLRFPELYSQLAKAGEKGDQVEYIMRGRQYIGYAKLERNSKWLVITSGEEGQVYASAYQVGLVVLGISLTFLAAISFVVIRFANGILNSLLSLIQYAKQVSEGKMEQKLQPTTRRDELGILHNSLERLVETLQTMIKETQEASQMKGRFLANMSHEIRTPLNAIIGMVHLSLRDDDLTANQRNYLDKIMLAAKALLGVINDILDISKVEAGMMAVESLPFDLRKTMEDTLTIHQNNAENKGLKLTLQYDMPGHDYFIGDSLRITQVINNLLSNAIKFTKQGGVTLRCWQELDIDKRQHVHFSVTDTGIGIKKEVLDTLFQPFTQADASVSRQYGGTGLGLTISDRLVHLMGGSFRVSSQEGHGSTFAFQLPLVEDTEHQQHRQSVDKKVEISAFNKINLSDKRILVAEDNSVNQFILKAMLKPTKAEISLANNGEEAIKAVQEKLYDLVLMDIQMPVVDGLEATKVIRTLENGRHMPIIAVTANAMLEDRDKSMAVGMNDYITKPIEPAELWRIINTWIVDKERDEA